MGIPSHSIWQWDGSSQQPFPVQSGIIPDPGTGSLYGSSTPMQDTQRIYTSAGTAPHVPSIPTAIGLMGDWLGAAQPDNAILGLGVQ